MNLPSPIRIALVDDHSLVRDGIKALLAVMSPCLLYTSPSPRD